MANILIVDDERQIIQQVRQLLTDMGHSSKFPIRPEFLFKLLEKEYFKL